MTTVKIYREEENINLIVNDSELEEYNELVKELGLSRREENSTKTPIVYPYLNYAMRRQVRALVPQSIEIEKYDKTSIPLEVLKAYKFCKDQNMFDGYNIWYNDVKPDPILIGWKWENENAKVNKYNWSKDPYIIARWGDCDLELKELVEKGNEAMLAEFKDQVHVILNKINDYKENSEVYLRKLLGGDDFSFNVNFTQARTFYV